MSYTKVAYYFYNSFDSLSYISLNCDHQVFLNRLNTIVFTRSAIIRWQCSNQAWSLCLAKKDSFLDFAYGYQRLRDVTLEFLNASTSVELRRKEHLKKSINCTERDPSTPIFQFSSFFCVFTSINWLNLDGEWRGSLMKRIAFFEDIDSIISIVFTGSFDIVTVIYVASVYGLIIFNWNTSWVKYRNSILVSSRVNWVDIIFLYVRRMRYLFFDDYFTFFNSM